MYCHSLLLVCNLSLQLAEVKKIACFDCNVLSVVQNEPIVRVKISSDNSYCRPGSHSWKVRCGIVSLL